MANGISPMEMAEIDAAILAKQALSMGASPQEVQGLLRGGGQVAQSVPTSTINPVQSPSGLLGIVGDMFSSRPKINNISDVFNPSGLAGMLPQADTMRALQQEQPPQQEGMLTASDVVQAVVPTIRKDGDVIVDPKEVSSLVNPDQQKQKEVIEANQRINDPQQPTTPEDLVTVTDAQKNAAKGQGVETVIPKPPEIEQGTWDKFTSQIDLTTVGLSLLATSGNGKSLAENMGLALAAGKQASIDQALAEEAKTDRGLNRKKKIAEIRKLAADAQKSLAEATGELIKDPTATAISVEQGFLQSVTGSKEVPKDMADYSARLRQQLRVQGVADKNQQDQFISEKLQQDGFLDEKFFGGLGDVSASTRLGM